MSPANPDSSNGASTNATQPGSSSGGHIARLQTSASHPGSMMSYGLMRDGMSPATAFMDPAAGHHDPLDSSGSAMSWAAPTGGSSAPRKSNGEAVASLRSADNGNGEGGLMEPLLQAVMEGTTPSQGDGIGPAANLQATWWDSTSSDAGADPEGEHADGGPDGNLDPMLAPPSQRAALPEDAAAWGDYFASFLSSLG